MESMLIVNLYTYIRPTIITIKFHEDISVDHMSRTLFKLNTRGQKNINIYN